MASNHEFYQLLEENRVTFTSNNRLWRYELKKRYHLLKENEASFSARSKGRRSIRLRARKILVLVFARLGFDVFLLCAMAPCNKLAQVETETLIQDLRRWWEGVEHPDRLAVAAQEIFRDYPDILELLAIPESRQRPRKKQKRTNGIRKTNIAISTSDIIPVNQTQHITAVPQVSSSNPNPAAAQEQRVLETSRTKRIDNPAEGSEEVLENASLQGITEVFNRYMCDAIRHIMVDGESKAAIAMVFPGWVGPVQCLISLDICTKDVEHLAHTLFDAKVQWAEDMLHVSLDNGFSMIIPNSEATLKGVSKENIAKVFSPEIYEAISECPVHKREIEEGKSVTECVSMLFEGDRAIINLSLGLEAGIGLQKKLYN